MMEPISQRTKDDCTICVVSMVMGTPFSYERVSLGGRYSSRRRAVAYGLQTRFGGFLIKLRIRGGVRGRSVSPHSRFVLIE